MIRFLKTFTDPVYLILHVLMFCALGNLTIVLIWAFNQF